MRALIFSLLAVVLAGNPEKTITESDFKADKDQILKGEVTVKVGETIKVNLGSNPSTGFRWQILGPDYGPLALKKTGYIQRTDNGNPPPPGSGGTQSFEFEAKMAGQQVVLVFNYRRPFEGLSNRTVELRVRVEE